MKKLIEKAVNIIYLVFMICFVLSIAIYDIHNEYVAIMVVADVIAVALVAIVAVMFKKKVFENKKVLGYIGLTALIVFGIVARIVLINIDYKKPQSDYATFYYNAVSFAKTNKIAHSYYIATFPYLAPYIMVLGCFFKIVGTAYKNVVILNVLLDLLSAGILYLTCFKDDKKKASLLFVLWLISPLNIFWCGFCAPVTMVNFFMLLVFCIAYKNEEKMITRKSTIIYSLLFGLLIGMANCFRPIFIVGIIAIILYRIYLMFSEKSFKVVWCYLGVVALLIGYVITTHVGRIIIQSCNEEKLSTTVGWTFYVGLNEKYNGMWNEDDNKEINKVIQENTPEETQRYFKDKAIERFKENGVYGNIILLKNKFEVLTNQNGPYTSDYFFYIQNMVKSKYVIFGFRVITKMIVSMIVIGNLLIAFLKKDMRLKILPMLLVMGLITSHLFVEVSPRYSLHAYIPMLVMLVNL